MVRLSGRVVGDEIAIEFIGTRPGEKLEEELQDSDEEAHATTHPAITRLTPIEIDGDRLDRGIDELAHLGALGRDDSVRRLLADLTTVDAGDVDQACPANYVREHRLMEPLAYLQIVRRRWWLIVGLILAAVLIVYVTTPERFVDHYEATHVLLVEGDREASGDNSAANPEVVALWAKEDEVLSGAAAELGLGVNTERLSREVSVATDRAVDTVSITARDDDPDFSALMANTVAAETVSFLVDREAARQQAIDDGTRRSRDRVAGADQRAGCVDRQEPARRRDHHRGAGRVDPPAR